MNETLIQAIRALTAIQEAAGKAYPFKNIEGEMIPEEEYRSATPDADDLGDGIPQERAREDRAKMLDILRDFYRAQHGTPEGLDDFVTLVGVYCNDYIRWNLHQALPEDEDFAITEIFDVITDESLKTCVCMIQQGISVGMYGGFRSFYEASQTYPYSLPNLYLFLRYAIKYGELQEDEQEERWAMRMVDCLASMNPGLREYCLGTSLFLKPNEVFDENPLPYALFLDEEDYHKARLAEKFQMNIKTLLPMLENMDTKKPTLEEVIVPLHGILECMDGMNRQEENAAIDEMEDEDEAAGEDDAEGFDPDRNDAPLFRLRFLEIPCRIDWGKETFSNVMNVMASRQRALREKELAQESKNEIVREFTHTYKNMKATTLYDIAKTLLAKQDEADKEFGRTLLLEYSNKKTLTKEVFMMQLRYERNTKRLLKSIRESCTAAGGAANAKRIEDLVEQALVTCLISIFYDKSQDRNDMRLPFLRALSREARRAIYTSFDQEVMQDRLRALDLLRSHGLDIVLDVSPEWATLAFLPDEYAAVFLKDILVELLVNTMKYGDLHQPIRFAFTAEDDKLLLSAANALPTDTRASGTRIGLFSIGDKLSVLWGDDLLSPVPHQRVTKDEKTFRVQMALPRAAFCKERG